MVVAFVLVQSEIGTVELLVQEIRKLEEVVEAYMVAGPYDIIVKIQAQKFEEVAKTVTEKLHKLAGVKTTLTLFCFG